MKYLYSIFILLSVTSIFFAQGDKHELNKISFSFAIGIDHVPDGYEISLQIINPASLAGEKPVKNSPYIVYKGQGKTIDTALENISINMSRYVHLRQIQIVVLGEKLVRNDKIKEVVDYILHSTDIPASALMVTTKDSTASELLEVFAPVEGFSSLAIINTLKLLGKNVLKTANDVKVDLIEEGKDIVLPYIYLKGTIKQGGKQDNFETTTPTHISYGGAALFKDNKLQTYLDYPDSFYLFLLEYNTSGFSIEASCPNEENGFVFRLDNAIMKKKKVQVKENKYLFNFDLSLTGDISQYNCHLDLKDPKTSKALKKQLEKAIQSKVLNIYTIVEDYKIDPIGLGEIIHQQDNQTWNKIKSDWPSLISKSIINVNSHIHIKNAGNFKGRGD